MRATGHTLALIFSVAMAACGSSEDKNEEEPPVGTDPDAIGRFGEPFDWPVVSMHLALLPDGRVMSFGSTTDGRQGAMLHYNVWDPIQGTGPSSMLLLPNTTPTDISCAGQTLVPAILRREFEMSWDTWVTPTTAGKPIGWMSDADWEETIKVLKAYGGVDTPLKAADLFTNEFIPTGGEFVPPQPK